MGWDGMEWRVRDCELVKKGCIQATIGLGR